MTSETKASWKKVLLMGLGWALLSIMINFDAFALEVEKQGQVGKPAIVFVPGLASSGNLWSEWADQYAETHRVYVITAPGFAGAKARQNQAPFLQATVRELAALLEADGVKASIVVGHSIGGLMSLMLAHDYPGLVSKVLVVDSLPYLAGMFMPGVTPEAAKSRADFMAKQMMSMPRDMFLAQQKQGLVRLSKTPTFLPTLEKWSIASDQESVAMAFTEALGSDYREPLAAVEAEVTVLAAYSAQMPVSKEQLKSLYDKQYAALKHKEILVVDDSFHFIMIDQPEAFGQALNAVVDGE